MQDVNSEESSNSSIHENCSMDDDDNDTGHGSDYNDSFSYFPNQSPKFEKTAYPSIFDQLALEEDGDCNDNSFNSASQSQRHRQLYSTKFNNNNDKSPSFFDSHFTNNQFRKNGNYNSYNTISNNRNQNQPIRADHSFSISSSTSPTVGGWKSVQKLTKYFTESPASPLSSTSGGIEDESRNRCFKDYCSKPVPESMQQTVHSNKDDNDKFAQKSSFYTNFTDNNDPFYTKYRSRREQHPRGQMLITKNGKILNHPLLTSKLLLGRVECNNIVKPNFKSVKNSIPPPHPPPSFNAYLHPNISPIIAQKQLSQLRPFYLTNTEDIPAKNFNFSTVKKKKEEGGGKGLKHVFFKNLPPDSTAATVTASPIERETMSLTRSSKRTTSRNTKINTSILNEIFPPQIPTKSFKPGGGASLFVDKKISGNSLTKITPNTYGKRINLTDIFV